MTAEYVPEDEVELIVTAVHVLDEEEVLATKLMMTADHIHILEVLMVGAECEP